MDKVVDWPEQVSLVDFPNASGLYLRFGDILYKRFEVLLGV